METYSARLARSWSDLFVGLASLLAELVLESTETETQGFVRSFPLKAVVECKFTLAL